MAAPGPLSHFSLIHLVWAFTSVAGLWKGNCVMCCILYLTKKRPTGSAGIGSQKKRTVFRERKLKTLKSHDAGVHSYNENHEQALKETSSWKKESQTKAEEQNLNGWIRLFNDLPPSFSCSCCSSSPVQVTYTKVLFSSDPLSLMSQLWLVDRAAALCLGSFLLHSSVTDMITRCLYLFLLVAWQSIYRPLSYSWYSTQFI